MVGFPGYNGPFDLLRAQVFLGSLIQQVYKFFIRCKAERYYLAYTEARIEQLPGKHITPEVFFGTYCPVLYFHRELPGVPEKQQAAGKHIFDQYSAHKASMVRHMPECIYCCNQGAQ